MSSGSKLDKINDTYIENFRWSITKIREVVYIKGRIGWKGLKKSEFGNEGILIINGPNLESGHVKWTECLRVPEWRFLESKEIAVKVNDVLLTKDGTIGKVAFIEKLPEPATLASGIFLLRSKNENILFPKFLYSYLNSKLFANFVSKRVEGSVISHLYQRDIEEIDLPLPPY